ncbi:rhamnosyltransferase WsaF family glycosyltransferase [Rhodoblastus sp.]|uniref:rhamnosyltransferase WsaF family glycosyltransferase n=1 Tax=Rhodoblastus sp. TaxID=1962975 RepID=UPI003F94A579
MVLMQRFQFLTGPNESIAKKLVSKLFSEKWYNSQIPQTSEADNDALLHYIRVGWREGRSPHPLFDGVWYLSKYPDIAQANVNPLLHFMTFGWKEGRSPHPFFDSMWYRAKNTEVVPTGTNPVIHFLKAGGAEGLSPHPLFDCKWYLSQYPTMTECGHNPLVHFIEYGWREGRSPHPLFDANWYFQNNTDVAHAKLNPLLHYINSGHREGRSPHPLFDAIWYAWSNPDVNPAEINPLLHFVEYGWKEHRSPHPLFDIDWYLEQNPDLAHAGLNPLAHFATIGWKEKRSPHPLFDTRWYLAQNPDVDSAGINPLVHYCSSGWREHRSPHPLFDTKWYLDQNEDVRAVGLNPLVHFTSSGWRERRSPHPLFDVRWYLNHYPEIESAGLDPVKHYLGKGGREGFAPNELFDSAFYIRNHESISSTGENPLIHYVTLGAEEGRAPHPLFDSEWYCAQHPELAEHGGNPLVHFLTVGARLGFTTHPADKHSATCEVLDIPYEVIKIPESVKDKDVCIFVTFSADGHVYDHVTAYLSALRLKGWVVIVVLATNGLAKPLPFELTSAEGLIVRINHGWDFAAWATALGALPQLWTARTLLMTNDSVYGPVNFESFDRTLAAIQVSNSDVVALTDSYQAWRHFMSYFWVLKQSALSSPVIRNFWAGIKSIRDKEELIKRYELSMLQKFRAGGLTVDILFPSDENDPTPGNPTLALWRQLIERGFPFVKVQALRDSLEGVDVSDWRDVLSFNPTLVENISDHLQDIRGSTAPIRPAPFPAPKRRFVRPRKLSTFYGATTATRLTEETDLVLETPFGYSLRKIDLPEKVAAIVHIFYADMAIELRAKLENIPIETDIFVSTDSIAKKEQIEGSFAGYANGKCAVNVFPNIGRDIAPMIVGYRDVFDEYEYFIHIHSKKSPHDEIFGKWRSYLLDNILGNEKAVSSILYTLRQTDVGIVFSDHFPAVRNLINWGYNFNSIKSVLGRFGVSLDIDLPLDFPSSSFFWGKTSAFRPLLQLGLGWDDFQAEEGQVDGTLAHALERSVLFACEAAGFRWVKVSNCSNTPSARLLPVHYPEDLEPALLQAHRPLIGNPVRPFVYQNIVPEVKKQATRKDAGPRPRLNLLLPTLKPEKVFGGISTAMRTFKEVGAALGEDFELRIIVTSDPVDLPSTQAHPDFCLVRLGASYDNFRHTIVDASDVDYGGEVPIRSNDIFLATAWWTAAVGQSLAQAQVRYFGKSTPFIYLIQDYEPGFYKWSSHYGYALATYTRGRDTIALVNSEELAAFVQSKFLFSEAYVVRYKANQAIISSRKALPRERIILLYGRPTTDRNCFDTIRGALLLWQHTNPVVAQQWRIVSAGEEYDSAYVRGILNLEIKGKMTLEDYGDILSRSSIGISLMVSPHPSYPPLEMAEAGLLTITNNYEYKDMTKRSKNIITIGELTPDALALALEAAVYSAEKFIGSERQFDEIGPLHSDFPDYDPQLLAQRLRRSLDNIA